MSIGHRSVLAVFWGTGGTALRIVLQFGSQIIMARCLGPAEYGLVAVGGIIIGLCSFFADFGLAYGLIQKREVTDRDVRFAFTWQVLVGAAVTASIVLLSGPISQFFGEPGSQMVIAVMALICLVNAAAGTALSLLKRNLDFKTQQISFLISYVIGFFCIGIPLALTGHGVWSLVTAWVVQATLWAVLLYLAVRHSLRPLFWYAEGRAQGSYGLTVLRTNVLNWFIINVDRIMIGRLLPTRDIGLYATVHTMVYTPSTSILSVVQPVLFSAAARVAQDSERDASEKIVRIYSSLVATVCLYLLPVFVAAAVLSEDFVVAIYGSVWSDAAGAFRPLALAMPFLLFHGLGTPVLWACGRPQDEFGKQWFMAIVWALACWALASIGGINAVGWGMVGLCVARFVVVLHVITRLTALRWLDVWVGARGGVVASGVVASCAYLVDRGMHLFGCSPAACLAIAAMCTVLLYLVALRFIPRLIGRDVSVLMYEVSHRLPRRVVDRLSWLWGSREMAR